MSTAKSLQLVLIITILFGLSSMGSIIQLSKATKLHRLNYAYISNVSLLNEDVKNYSNIPLQTEKIIGRMENIRNLTGECLTLVNALDKLIIKLIKSSDIVSLCQNDNNLAEQLLTELYENNNVIISENTLIDSITDSTYVFTRNSKLLEKPVNSISASNIKMAFGLIVPFSVFIVFLSIYIFRKIRINTARLTNAIGALERSEEEKKVLAYYDALTSLPNRNLFAKILEHEIHQVKRYNKSFALLFIDLDRFKFINDTLGHEAGDDLLLQVSQRLKACVRESDTLARFGGDEFLLILSGNNSDKYVKVVADKIIKSISMPFMLDEHEMHISASIGICLCPLNGVDSTTLLKRADIAMYEAKSNGKNQYCAYAEDRINHNTEHRLLLEKDIRHALEENELQIHYQPVINLNNQSMVDVEALLRWKHHDKGMILTSDFIPIAEETGMMKDIGIWMIEQACIQCKEWRTAPEKSNFHIAVNISASQLTDNNLPAFISDTLTHYDLPADAINFEITENIHYANNKRITNNLNSLKEIGINLLLDDFGTGYSSLSTLHGLPFDVIKIDQSFMDINHPKKRIMTQTIINLAKNFDMETIAEGVEDQIAIDFLRRCGCNFAQGYYLQRPVPAEELDITKLYGQIQMPATHIRTSIQQGSD
jgi:diguanylate cyclase (GGDEF)-like protein